MGTNSKIEWTDHTWNPWRGCTKVSPACDNCYMFRDAARFGLDASIVTRSAKKTLLAPFSRKWKAGDKVFVCSWSDFFHPGANEWRGDVWDIIDTRNDLIFLLLTKRPELIKECLPSDWGEGWPNVWLGVTAENQEQANKRVPVLLSTPAAKRFVSIEPMLGPIDLWSLMSGTHGGWGITGAITSWEGHGLDWVICGGESGPKARPLHPVWVRSLRDQCQMAKVPFMFKQWGEWWPIHGTGVVTRDDLSLDPDAKPAQPFIWVGLDGKTFPSGGEPDALMLRVGRAKSGCELDGGMWKEFPEEAKCAT